MFDNNSKTSYTFVIEIAREERKWNEKYRKP